MIETSPCNLKQNYYPRIEDVVYVHRRALPCGCCVHFQLMTEKNGLVFEVYNPLKTLDGAINIARAYGLTPVLVH